MNNIEYQKLAADFAALTVKHQKQNDALRDATFLLTMCENVDFVLIAGPTGAGKSHLLERLQKEVNQFYRQEVAEFPSMVPYLATVAVADGARKFGWKRCWSDASKGLHDPFVGARSWRTSENPTFRYPGESFTTGVARQDFERELQLRRTKVWGIDEAHHILLGGVAGEPSDQFEVLKSVSQITPIKLVLCGTYQLPRLLNYSGQVMRRSATVTLAPYSLQHKSDVVHFVSICKTFLEKLPSNTRLEPADCAEELFFGTLGCVGVLKDWIARAWANAHFKSAPSMTMDHLMATRLPAETLLSMHNEIVAGEALNSVNAEALYRHQVNEHAAGKPSTAGFTLPTKAAQSKRNLKSAGAHHKPGVRRPGRDPVKSCAERKSLHKDASHE
jgi:energy-coupling factor transporter ATP-binding protein EcfA2